MFLSISNRVDLTNLFYLIVLKSLLGKCNDKVLLFFCSRVGATYYFDDVINKEQKSSKNTVLTIFFV